MKRGSTIFLKISVFLIGIPVIALCIFALPSIASEASNTEYASFVYPVLAAMYIAAIPFFIALYQALRLLSFIDENKAFSESSVTALKKIKFSAVTISVVYMAAMPCFYLIGELDDAPGVIVIGLVFVFASLVIAVFTAVLQMLLNNAIAIKSENDLTV